MDDLLKPALVVWEKLLPPLPGGKTALQQVLAAYGAPGRHYHTIQHITEMTQLLLEQQQLLPGTENVLFACLWHDFVYDAQRSDNEEKSAEFWRAAAGKMQIPPAQIARVAELILATRKHQPGDASLEMALFLDADLAILGATPERYAAYAQGVRQEYAHVPEADYRAGRSAVLKKFLDRPQLYFTAEMRARFEAQARTNIAMEIHSLN